LKTSEPQQTLPVEAFDKIITQLNFNFQLIVHLTHTEVVQYEE